MATTKENVNPRKQYTVLKPYQCANTRHWLQKNDSVELLPCEAEFLKNNGKIKLSVAPTTQLQNRNK